MNIEDYSKYYVQGSDHYLIPKDVFNELFDEMVNWREESKELKDLIDTMLNFSFFKEECPLNFGFENNTNEDKSQSIFYEDEWCENNCNDNYKDCWLKYFKKLQELEQGSDSNE